MGARKPAPQLSGSSTSQISSPARRPSRSQHVAAAEAIKAGTQAGPAAARPAAAVVTDAPAASRPERVQLSVEHLLALAGGHPRVADRRHASLRLVAVATGSVGAGLSANDFSVLFRRRTGRLGRPEQRRDKQAMPQAQVFAVCRLALVAQSQAARFAPISAGG